MIITISGIERLLLETVGSVACFRPHHSETPGPRLGKNPRFDSTNDEIAKKDWLCDAVKGYSERHSVVGLIDCRTWWWYGVDYEDDTSGRR